MREARAALCGVLAGLMAYSALNPSPVAAEQTSCFGEATTRQPDAVVDCTPAPGGACTYEITKYWTVYFVDGYERPAQITGSGQKGYEGGVLDRHSAFGNS